jgi:hypothetical protein
MKNRLPVEFQNLMQVHRTTDQVSVVYYYDLDGAGDIFWIKSLNHTS